MSERTTDIACPRCGEMITLNLNELDKLEEVIYREITINAAEKKYRVPCPACGTKIVATIAEGE